MGKWAAAKQNLSLDETGEYRMHSAPGIFLSLRKTPKNLT